jgi:hypothetical protein
MVWLNILCLDAPIVAISWQWLFARVLAVAVPLAEREGLFLTAWLIYLMDRLADSISLSPDVPKAVRHEFCSRHKNIWAGLIAIIFSPRPRAKPWQDRHLPLPPCFSPVSVCLIAWLSPSRSAI